VLKDGAREVLKGICFKDSDMVASDAQRIALNTHESFSVSEPIIVPCDAIKYVNDTMGEQLTIKTDKKYIQFTDDGGSMEIICRLYDGEYVNYSKFMEQRGEHEIEIDIKDFTDSLKYLNTFTTAREKSYVSWFDNKLGLKNGQGYYETEVNVSGSMAEEIMFIGVHMQEALSKFKGDSVKIYIDGTSPLLLASETDSENTALLIQTKPKDRLFQKDSVKRRYKYK